jgi:hypothetical protein
VLYRFSIHRNVKQTYHVSQCEHYRYLYRPPQIHFLPPQQPQIVYLPSAPPQYQPTPQPQAKPPVSYYPGHSPEPTDYPQEIYYLPTSQPVGQLPPARASDIDEARRRFEMERTA